MADLSCYYVFHLKIGYFLNKEPLPTFLKRAFLFEVR